MVAINVDGKPSDAAIPNEMPFVWTLRDLLSMTGTKFGCGTGLCGACTIYIDGQPTRSCTTPLSAAVGKRIITIEVIRPRQELAGAYQPPEDSNPVLA